MASEQFKFIHYTIKIVPITFNTLAILSVKDDQHITQSMTSLEIEDLEHDRFDFTRVDIEEVLPMDLRELLQLFELAHEV